MTQKTKQEEFEESKSLINAANEASERLEAAMKEHTDLAVRLEQVAARITLGGRSEAGAKEEPKPETPKEYKDRIMSGTRP